MREYPGTGRTSIDTWATYLTTNTLTPNNQNTADLESQANMTNLAVKGIIGVRAMAGISQALGKDDDAAAFTNAASTLASSWQSLALSQDGSHLVAAYGNDQSWTLPYNLYADRLLQTSLISNDIYSSETSFLKGLLSATGSLATPFGLPIDTLTATSQGDAAWTMFTAAITTDASVRESLMDAVLTHITSNQSTFPFSKTYKLDSTGAYVSGRSSPGFGAIFAPLALNVAAKTIVVPPEPVSSQKTSIVGPVVGGVVGGLGLIAIIVLAFVFWRRRQRRKFAFGGRMDMDEMATSSPPVAGVTIYSLDAHRDSLQRLNPEGRESRDIITPGVTTTTDTRISKAREAALDRYPQPPIPVSTTSATDFSGSGSGSSPPASSREPPTTIVSPTEVQGLRVEVENLRRAMQEIQADRIDLPPPSYTQQ